MRTSPLVPAAAMLVLTLAGCGGAEEGFRAGSGQPPATVTVQATPTAPAAPAPAAQVEIPDVEGRNGAIALDELRKAGLTNVQPASQDEEDKFVVNPANWQVVTIEPGAGTTVAGGDTVVVTMTKQK